MFKTVYAAEVSTPTRIDAAIAQLEWENRQRALNQHQQASAADALSDEGRYTEIEPLAEPATDEIPWRELAYWLDTSPPSSGRTDCACSSCRPQSAVYREAPYNPSAGHYVFIPGSFYSRLSVKIPVIRLPRIEGVN